MEDLLLENNMFTGPIPSSLRQLSFLEALRLENNLLTGTVPTALCELRDHATPLLLDLAVDCLTELDCPASCCTECF